jgi:hypothetical protein
MNAAPPSGSSSKPLRAARARASLDRASTPDFSARSDAFRGLPEGRGFSPAEIAAPTPCLSRAPRSLQPQAARGSEQENNQEGLVTAGLKPRPAISMVRNAG